MVQTSRLTSLSEIWESFNSVHFLVSLDGSRSLNPQLRSGSDMKLFEANIAYLRQRFPVSINSVVSQLNAFYLHDLFEYVENELGFSAELHHLSTLSFPEKLSLKTLTASSKQELIEYLSKLDEMFPQRKDQLRPIKNFLS
jgi:sulfatase maturation enzyme AslB (radical SAM superfamily)